MSRFRRLNLDESREEFPLLNEEARKALKGGCDTCEQWLEQYPGLTIYSMEEYESMCKAGTWKVGAVCGLGLSVLAEVIVEGKRPDNSSFCGKHFWPIENRECEYCYFEDLGYCPTHNTYYGNSGLCYLCGQAGYYDNNNIPRPGNSGNQNGNTWHKEVVGEMVLNSVLRNSPFAQELFWNYWEGNGDMVLGKSRFEGIAEAVVKMNIDYTTGETVVINGDTYYKMMVSFYDNSDYELALGTATVYYDQVGHVVGLKDRYDFNSMPKGVRTWWAETMTNWMDGLGSVYNAKDFNVLYGIHD